MVVVLQSETFPMFAFSKSCSRVVPISDMLPLQSVNRGHRVRASSLDESPGAIHFAIRLMVEAQQSENNRHFRIFKIHQQGCLPSLRYPRPNQPSLGKRGRPVGCAEYRVIRFAVG